MKRDYLPCDPELAVLFERAKVIGPVPDLVRARLLARARANVAASAFLPEPLPVARDHRLGFAFGALICFAVGAASAAAALRSPTRVVMAPTMASSARVVPSVRNVKVDPSPAPGTAAPRRNPTSRPRRPAPLAATEESYAAEVAILQRAQAAYTDRDFSGALMLLAEHGGLFPKGRMAEDREALRVRSLAGSGRTDDARRVFGAFTDRFPRSVLLRPLQETPKTGLRRMRFDEGIPL